MSLGKDLKSLAPWVRPFKKRLILFSLLAVFIAVVSSAVPYVYGYLVDAVVARKSIFFIAGIMLGWLIFTFISDYIQRYNESHGGILALESQNNMVKESTRHILSLPLSFHYKNKTGEITRKITEASNNIDQLIFVMIEALPQVITVVLVLGILFFIDYRISLILMFVLFLYTVVTIIKTKNIIKFNVPMNRAFEKAYGSLWDSLYNPQVVKANSNIEHEHRKHHRNFAQVVKRAWGFNIAWRETSFWQQTIFALGFVGLFSFSLWLLYIEKISAGNLVSFIGYIALVFTPFISLARNYRIFRRGVNNISRLNVVMRIKDEKGIRKYNEEVPELTGQVTFKNIYFGYDKKIKILKNINLKVRAGEVVALVGKTGSGKSTFVDLLSGYFLPTSGKILVDGHDITKFEVDGFRNQLAYVPQETVLFNDTALNNIKYGKLDATMNEVKSVSKLSNADEFIKKLPEKYKTIVGERGVKLSVGQKQRVAIARALIRNPKILILDEATSSLDSITEKLVQQALDTLMKGRTTFVIAHRLSTIVRSDRILVIDDGKIVEQGTHQQLLKNKKGHYYKLYNTQNLFKE